MRRLVIALVLTLLWASAALAQVTKVGSDIAVTGGSSITTLDNEISTSSGETLIAVVLHRQGSEATTAVSGVEIVSGSAFTQVVYHWVADTVAAGIWCLASSPGGTVTVRATFSSAINTPYINVSRWTGVRDCTAEDTDTALNSATTTHVHGSLTTTGPGLIIGAVTLSAYGRTKTAADGFTALVQNDPEQRFFGQYRITTGGVTNETISTTISSADSSRAASAAFAAAEGGSARRGLLLGVGK